MAQRLLQLRVLFDERGIGVAGGDDVGGPIIFQLSPYITSPKSIAEEFVVCVSHDYLVAWIDVQRRRGKCGSGHDALPSLATLAIFASCHSLKTSSALFLYHSCTSCSM